MHGERFREAAHRPSGGTSRNKNTQKSLFFFRTYSMRSGKEIVALHVSTSLLWMEVVDRERGNQASRVYNACYAILHVIETRFAMTRY